MNRDKPRFGQTKTRTEINQTPKRKALLLKIDYNETTSDKEQISFNQES